MPQERNNKYWEERQELDLGRIEELQKSGISKNKTFLVLFYSGCFSTEKKNALTNREIAFIMKNKKEFNSMTKHKNIKITENDVQVVELMKNFLSYQGFKNAQIILFGSRARGDMVEDSDYDFMILIENDLMSQEKRTLQANLARYLIKKKKMLPMDVIIKSKKRFEEERQYNGNLAYAVNLEGVAL